MKPTTSKTVFRSGSFLLALALMMMIAPALQAQKLKFGPRFGLGASGIQTDEILIKDLNDVNSLRLELQNASPEAQVGVFGRLSLFGFYVQPEVLLTTASTKYLVEDLQNGGTDILKERYWNLEVPVMAGIKLGPLRAQAGPVFHTPLANVSQLTDISGLSRTYRESSVGIQGGLGLDLGKKIVFDVKYEADLTGMRDEISIFGQTHDVSDRGGRLIASLGVSF